MGCWMIDGNKKWLYWGLVVWILRWVHSWISFHKTKQSPLKPSRALLSGPHGAGALSLRACRVPLITTRPVWQCALTFLTFPLLLLFFFFYTHGSFFLSSHFSLPQRLRMTIDSKLYLCRYSKNTQQRIVWSVLTQTLHQHHDSTGYRQSIYPYSSHH